LDAFLAQYVHPSLRAAGFRKSHHSYRLNTALGDHALVRFVGSPLPDTLGSFWVQVSVILEPDWDLHFFQAHQRRSFPKRPAELDATFYWAALPGAAPHPRWSYNTLAERDQLGEELRGQLGVELIPAVRRLLDRQLACEETREDAQIPGHLQSERTYCALLTDAGPSTELDEALVAAQERNTDADRKFIQRAQMRLLDGPTWISSDLSSPIQNLPE
jgi:hypothetical protein